VFTLGVICVFIVSKKILRLALRALEIFVLPIAGIKYFMIRPHVYIIAQVDSSNKISKKNHEISVGCLATTQKLLDQYGWDWTVWPAQDGYAVTDQTWEQLGIFLYTGGGKLPDRPGAQGCVISHFRLWQHCVKTDQPMIVLEHDAQLVDCRWPEYLDINARIYKLHARTKHKGNPVTGDWSTGTYAYTLVPWQAQTLIDSVIKHGAQSSDKLIGSNIVEWDYSPQTLFQHDPAIRRSTTSRMNQKNS